MSISYELSSTCLIIYDPGEEFCGGVGEPDIFGKEGDDLVLLEILWVEDRRAREGVRYDVVGAFDICNFHIEIDELYRPSGVSVGQVLGFFEELESDVVCENGELMGNGYEHVPPFL